MDPIANPYAMGAGNPPSTLAGRKPEIEKFKNLLGRLANEKGEPSLIVSGIRGVGKTVLLLEFGSIALDLDWIAPDPIEIRPDTNFRHELATQAEQVLRGLSRKKALGDKVNNFVDVLKAFKWGANSEGNLEFSFDPEVFASTGNLEYDLSQLFIELGQEAKKRNTGVVFLIDEMQFLQTNEMEAVAAAMHRMSQKNLPIALAGAGLPQLPLLMIKAKSYAERLFSYPSLEHLDDEAAKEALVIPAEKEEVLYEDDALGLILELSGGYPAFLQAYAKETWNIAPASPINIENVKIASSLVQENLDTEFFGPRVKRVTPKEELYMSAMATLKAPPYKTADIAAKLDKKANEVSVERNSLINKGLIYSPQFGYIDFTVPQFANFLLRKHPFVESSSE